MERYFCEICHTPATDDGQSVKKACECKDGSIILDLSLVFYGVGGAKEDGIIERLRQIGIAYLKKLGMLNAE